MKSISLIEKCKKCGYLKGFEVIDNKCIYCGNKTIFVDINSN